MENNKMKEEAINYYTIIHCIDCKKTKNQIQVTFSNRNNVDWFKGLTEDEYKNLIDLLDKYITMIDTIKPLA